MTHEQPILCAEPMRLNDFFEQIERDPIHAPPLIGRTVKPRFLGPCKVCGERKFFCEHEL